MASLDDILRSLTPEEQRPLMLGPHAFPWLWRFFMPAELKSFRVPEEKNATCGNCPRVCDAGYRPDYRCCTYQPRVPNFLLGLASQTPLGSQALARAEEQQMLLPEGMVASPQQWLDFMEDQEQDLYGRSQRVLCPLLETKTGLCSIHAFRNAVCSTYFCEHEQGEAGEIFWAQLQTLGSQIELGLAQWALDQLGFSVPNYLEQLDSYAPRVEQLSAPQGWRSEILRELWGPWYGRSQELYQRCAALIVAHRHELWQLANTQTLREAKAFEAALDALSGEDTELQEPGAPEPAALTWEYCREAHAALWTPSNGRG